MSKQLKIVFFGTPQFSAGVLNVLAQQFEVVLAVTRADMPVGRRSQPQLSPVAEAAAVLKIPVIKPQSLKDSSTVEKIKNTDADLLVVVAYGKIIPAEILRLGKFGALNIHGSLLPKYRGASPIQAALLHGDQQTGITVMLMDEQLDHGATLLRKVLDVSNEETFIELEPRMQQLAETAIIEAIPLFINGDLPPEEQQHNQATFCGMIKKTDGKIDWSQPATQIFNQYRAYIKWPGIFTSLDGKNLKINKCWPTEIQSAENIQPGAVFQLNEQILVQCGQGALQLFEVQAEGKKNLPIAEFLKGHQGFVGALLI